MDVEIKIKVGDKELTLDEAEKLFKDLSRIFKDSSSGIPSPIPYYPTVLGADSWPWQPLRTWITAKTTDRTKLPDEYIITS